MKYIIEICVAIDIAILGIAYPLIINEINRIGEKYNSNYLSLAFQQEFPETRVDFKFLRISLIKFVLILTIGSFIFLILNLPPLFGLDFYLVNNSAELIVLGLSVSLVFLFIIWLDKVALYNGKPLNILLHLIKKYNNSIRNTDISKYYLKTINEFAYYAIRSQDSHIQRELLDFYSNEFGKERQLTVGEEAVEYSIELYDLVYNINLELANTKNLRLKAIEHQAVSGWWLYGSGFEHIKISNLTYSWVWSVLSLVIDKDEYIRMYWSKAHQYIDLGLNYLQPEYEDGTMNVLNTKEIENRQNEREKFLEFHYALGGLFLYKGKYKILKYILSYSQSSPPHYPLLPYNMTEIFKWYEEFRNEFKYRLEHIEVNYQFPELDNYGVSHQTTDWICNYLIILFIRQFSLQKIYTFQDHTGQPILPNDVLELRNWYDSVTSFEKNLNKIFLEDELFKELKYESLLKERQEDMLEFVAKLKKNISDKINFVEETKPLSKEKVAAFRETSDKIIKKGLDIYRDIINKYSRDTIYDKLKLTIQGSRILMGKDAFVDNEIPHLNYDSFLAESIVNQNIKYFFPNSFSTARTHRFLFGQDLIVEALNKAVNNDSEAVLIGFNIGYQVKEIVKKSFKDVYFLHSTNNRFGNVFFILKKDDLPVIIKRELPDELKDKYKLEPTSDGSQIYASVLDLGLDKNKEIREEWLNQKNAENIKLKAQVMIWFFWLILWKKDRKIIQISLDTRSDEQGVRDNIGDIETL